MTETGAIVGTVALPLARAGPGPAGRPPLRSLLGGRRALRAADRPRPVRRRGAGLDRAQARLRAPRCRPGSCAPGIPPALEAVVMRVAGEGPGAALPERRGVHRRARGRAPRAGAPVVLEPTPGEPWVEEQRLALVAVARWALLVVAAIAAGAWFLLAGNRVDVPNVVGRDASEAADILHDAGSRSAFVNTESDTVKRDEVISQDPAAGERVKEGTTVVVSVSAGPGHGRGPGRRGPAERRGREGRSRTRASIRAYEGGVLDSEVPAGRRHLRLARGRPAGHQGPHGHPDRLQGHRRACPCRRSSASSATTPRPSCRRPG